MLLPVLEEQRFTHKKLQWNLHLAYLKFEVYPHSMFNFNNRRSIFKVLNFPQLAFPSVYRSDPLLPKKTLNGDFTALAQIQWNKITHQKN
jgi:hypothetical protein